MFCNNLWTETSQSLAEMRIWTIGIKKFSAPILPKSTLYIFKNTDMTNISLMVSSGFISFYNHKLPLNSMEDFANHIVKGDFTVELIWKKREQYHVKHHNLDYVTHFFSFYTLISLIEKTSLMPYSMSLGALSVLVLVSGDQ